MMKLIIQIDGKDHEVDALEPLDISIPISPDGPRAWYVPKMRFAPVINTLFTGSVKLGGSVNFFDVYFNPHGHGTHTESVGHITGEHESVNALMNTFFFLAEVISITPIEIVKDEGFLRAGDQVIKAEQIKEQMKNASAKALVVRTLPNVKSKLNRNYSNTNFPYFEEAALQCIADAGIEHLLVDLPSVDREEDAGRLLAHRAFWKYPHATRSHCTITEFVFVPDHIGDGNYFLNLQVAPFENDAAASRPVLYRLKQVSQSK
jgi:arylformamidase